MATPFGNVAPRCTTLTPTKPRVPVRSPHCRGREGPKPLGRCVGNIVMGKSWANHGKIMGKNPENDWDTDHFLA